MAIYTINANDKVKINFAPLTTREEIIQNVRTLINTIKWSIPLARDVGISGDVIDMPILQAKARLSQEIFDVIAPMSRVPSFKRLILTPIYLVV